MRKLVFLLLLAIFAIYFTSYVLAQVLSTPTISSPTSGSSFSKGSTFTLTSTVSCSGDDCKGVQLAANLPSGLSTSSGNPQGCGKIDESQSCTKSWTVSANTVGTYSITVTASATNAASKTSSSISVTVAAVCGDSVCEGSETASNCPQDCGCPTGQILCSGSCVTPACNSNADCNDNNPDTTDTCNNPSTCTASCSSTAGAPAPSPIAPTLQSSTLQILSPTSNQSFKRGDTMNVRIKLTSGADNLIDAKATAEIFSFPYKLYDDGLHNDEKTNDGIYGNDIEIKSWHEGEYKIILAASKDGYTGSVTELKINVDPKLDVNITFDKSEYSKGIEMQISGDVKSKPKTSSYGGDVKILFSSGSWKFSKDEPLGVQGNFFAIYPISFGDPEGTWNVNVTIIDSFKNYVSKIFAMPVKTPPAGSFYYVKFLSPTEGLSYSRGEVVKTTVEVSELGTLISGSNVSLKTPTGDLIELNETSSGVYSTDYNIGWEHPTGNVSLVVEGKKEVKGAVKAGGNFILLKVNPAKIKVDLLSPTKTDFVAGEIVKLSVRAYYPDGTAVRSGSLETTSPSGEKIFLKEAEPGTYYAEYKIQEGEEGQWKMQLNAADTFQNSAALQKILFISQITIFYLLLQDWWAVALGASPFAYLGYRSYQKFSVKIGAQKMKEELGRIDKMKKDAQINYYKKGSIDKQTYSDMMKQYESREAELKSKLSRAKTKEK